MLTSSDDADLREAGYAFGVRELVERRARQALEAGVAGLVCSAAELLALRNKIVPPGFCLVTPGIRAAGAGSSDQKRIGTPRDAIRDGADFLVVGRPITEAADARAAAEAVAREIEAALL